VLEEESEPLTRKALSEGATPGDGGEQLAEIRVSAAELRVLEELGRERTVLGVRIEHRERSPHRIDARVARGAARVGEPVRDLADGLQEPGGRRWDRLAEQRAPDEQAAEDGP